MATKSFEIAISKGELGEMLVRQWLVLHGFIVYTPVLCGKQHAFDFFFMRGDKVYIGDVKTKARLNKWNAQGINIYQYERYLALSEKLGLPFWIFFVDDKTGDVHGQNILKLRSPIRVNRNIVAWDVSQMRHLFNIGEQWVRILSAFDQRSYDYSPQWTGVS